MFVQVGLEGERLAAGLAGKRLGIGVGLDVGAEIGLVCEGLRADAARERALALNQRIQKFAIKEGKHS